MWGSGRWGGHYRSGEVGGGEGTIGLGKWEAQTIEFYISFKDVLYNKGNTVNIL